MSTNTAHERRVEYLDLDELRPADRNPKTHDLAELRSSFGRFGFVEPIVRDDRTSKLVAGHGRVDTLRAARAAHSEPPAGVIVDDGRWLVPVLVGWSSRDDDEAQAYVLAANRLVERGGWDRTQLDDVLIDLEELLGEDAFAGTGYSVDDALAALSERLGDDDAADDDTDADPQLGAFTYRLVVECTDEQHQAELLERLEADGLVVRAVVS